MKSLAIFALVSFSLSALADIPRPPAHNNVELTVSGQDAVELYDSLKVEVLRGSSLRTSSSSYKVFRSESGLTQVVCEKTVRRVFTDEVGNHNGGSATSGSCKIQKSTDGKKLAEFKPVIRMG